MHPPRESPRHPTGVPCTRRHRALLFGLMLLGFASNAFTQGDTIPGSLPGRIESGVPSFVVIGPDGMGLNSPPTEIRRLSDGRILAVAQRQLAFGDGVRWDTFSLAPDIAGSGLRSVLVDDDDRLYAGAGTSFAEIAFGADSYWRFDHNTGVPTPDNTGTLVASTASHVAGDWFWHSSSGAVISWRPGQQPTSLGSTNAADSIFECAGKVYVSDRADGTLFHLVDGKLLPVFAPEQITPRHAISNSAPFDSTHALVGTHALGLMIFDGHTLRPFVETGLLAGGLRINDVCALPGGFFAAAVDRTGIAFFDRRGRIVQMLSQSVDHRLARPRKLLPGVDGVVWALLDEGLARVEFPSRTSHLEPLIATSVTIAMPFRHAGDLWLLADGRIQRGEYNEHGRLVRFNDETPDTGFVFAFSFAAGRLIIGGADGILVREDQQWRLAVPDIANARILPVPPRENRWLYAARGEIGWLTIDGDRFTTERIPVPDLADVYGAVTDRESIVWLELGAGMIGRLDSHSATPTLERFGAADGLPNSWAQAFVIDGIARFNVGNRIWRFDSATRRFVADDEFTRRYAANNIDGRPGRDPAGRLWMCADGEVRTLDDRGPLVRRLDERIPRGLTPYYFTFQEDGVVWLHENRRLARYDPTMPQLPPSPVRALITDIVLSSSNRRLFTKAGPIPPLAHVDNSLVAHFMAPANPFTQPVTFEVMLEGAGQDWVSTGSVGSAVFSRLKEGSYVLRVRPAFGQDRGVEDRLAFTVLAPWYRTGLAYLLYVLSTIALVALIARLTVYMERREKQRLELVVTTRTAELHEANRRLRSQVEETQRKAAELGASEERARHLNHTLQQQIEETLRQSLELQASEERFRRLSGELEERVTQRTAELNHANELLQSSNRELEAFSYSVSHDLRAPLRNISGFAELLLRKGTGRLDPESDRYLANVAGEAVRLGHLIDSLLAFSRINRTELQSQRVDLRALVDAVRAETATALTKRNVEWRISPLPTVRGDSTLLRQVLANLIGNALKFSRDRDPAIIEIATTAPSPEHPNELVFLVRDNGAGFDPKYTDKLFGVFQRLHSAKDFEGTGIGLANVRRIVLRHHGRVWAEGRPGEGATFYFSLPASSNAGA